MSNNVFPYSEIKTFKAFVQTVLPTVYDDSLSYYELLNKVVEHLNTMGNTINYMQAWLNANGVETYDIIVNSTYGSISGIIDEVKTAVNANKIVRFIVNPSGLYKYVCYYSGSAVETNDETETTKTMFYFAGFKIENSTRYTFRVFKLDTSNGNYTEYDYKLINETDLTSVVNNIFTYIDNTVNSAIPVHGEYNATSGVRSGADYDDFDGAINAGKVCSITIKRSNNPDVTCYYASKVIEQNEQFETFIFSGDTLNTNGSVKGVISVKVKPESVSFIETNIETDLSAINLTFDVVKQNNTYTLNTVNRTPTEVISALSSNSNLDAKIRVYSAVGDYLLAEYHDINYYGLTTATSTTIALNCSFTDDILKNITHTFNFYQDENDANVWQMQHTTNTEYYTLNFAIMPTSVQDDTPTVQTASATPSEISGYLSQVIHKPIRCYFSVVGGDTNTVYYNANGYSCNAYKYKENSSANEKVVVSFTDYPMYIEGDVVNNTWIVRKKDEIDNLKNELASIADIYYTSENLFNPATFENGKQLTSSGTIYDNSTFALSDYVPVKSGWVLNGYIAQNTINGLGGWFDENKVWQGKIEELSGYTLTDRNKRYFTLVCNFDGYIRVNVYVNAPYQQAMLKLNTVIDTSLSEPLCQNYHAYEPPYQKVSELKAQTSYGKYVHENNGMFDGTKAVSGYLASNGSQVWSNARYKTSDYIPVSENAFYIIQGITPYFCMYDSSKTSITSSFDTTATNNREFNSSNAAFVRFTYYATEESNMYIRASYGSFFDTQKGGAYFTDDNPLLGKTLYTIGDSIMAGDGNNGFGIGDIISSRNSMFLKDWAKGGATIGWRDSQGNSVYNIQYQATLASAENTPDYILIDGQTNDIDNASTIPVGEVSTSFDSTNFVNTTFAGGLETIFSNLKSAFPSAKIVYVRVHHIGSRGLDTQNTRCEIAKNVCYKWGVPIADIYGEGTLNTFISQYEQYTNNSDKTHPNRTGYDLFYIPIIESVMKSI